MKKTAFSADVRSVHIWEINIYFLYDIHLVTQPLNDFPDYATAGVNLPKGELENPLHSHGFLQFYFGKSKNTYIGEMLVCELNPSTN